MVVDAVLDTSIIIDLLRGDPRAVSWYQSLQTQEVAITPIVWIETVEGATNRIRLNQFTRFLKQFHVEHPTPKDNEWAMEQFAQFHLSHRIDYEDIMIASITVRLAVPLYTLNIRHYAPLPNLDERQPY
jgi:predicted nucleic acid-binding protein